MNKTLITISIFSSLLFIQCAEKKDPFLISSEGVGHITPETMIQEIDSLFTQDSIVRLSPIEEAIGTQGDVEIYEKGGKKLLLISPASEKDPESPVANIQLFDERFTTDKGLNVNSTFKVVKDNYTVSNIERIYRAVVVFLEETDVYITLDEGELPAELRYNKNLTIEASSIPDDATFKYLMVGWDQEEEEDQDTEDSGTGLDL